MNLLEHRLQAKRHALVVDSARLRQTVVDDLNALTPALGTVYRTSGAAIRAMRYAPWLIGAGIALLVWKKPRGLVETGRKLITLWQYCAPLQPWLLARLRRSTEPSRPLDESNSG